MLGLADKAGDIMRTVDKLPKIGEEKVSALLTGELEINPEAALDGDELQDLPGGLRVDFQLPGEQGGGRTPPRRTCSSCP